MVNEIQNYKGKFTCKNCGNVFLVTKPRYSHPNFCCRDCTHKYHGPFKRNKVIVSCTQCNKDIMIHPYKLKRSPTHFCNVYCKSLFFKDNQEFIEKLKIGCQNRPPVSMETRIKLSIALSGKKKKTPFTKEHREKLRKNRLGKKATLETRMKMRLSAKLTFENNMFQSEQSISKLNKRLRGSCMYKIWRESVFLRDNFTCQNPNCPYCHNKIGVFINSHHIKSFTFFPELRFDINNGITYCKDFHLKSGLHKNIKHQNMEAE